MSSEDTALDPAALAHLVQLATLAPSVHNTQPWRFATGPYGLALQRDRTRGLSALDPDGRELLISCGAAAHHLQVAARATGVDCQVELLPDDEPDTVARLRLRRGAPAAPDEVAAAVAVLHRHTHRGRFEDREVPAGLLDRLRTAVEGQHAVLRVVRPDELVEVEVLVSRAEQSLRQSPDYTSELERWVWVDGSPVDRTDGLPPGAVAHGPGRAESLQGRQFGPDAPPRPTEPPVAEHPAVVLLATVGDSERDWLQAGQALSALLLTATTGGLLAQPIGQVVDVPATRWALRDRLGTVGAPQMLLRLGFGTSRAATPRRGVDEVLLAAGTTA